MSEQDEFANEGDIAPMTPLQAKVAELYLAAKEPRDIGLELGISTRIVNRELSAPAVRLTLAIALDNAGCTMEKTAAVIAKLHDAKVKKFFAFEGEVVSEREVDDNQAQLAAAKLAAQARGELQPDIQVQVNKFEGLTEAQFREVIAGRAKVADFIPRGGPGA